jgi:hypothetical protein
MVIEGHREEVPLGRSMPVLAPPSVTPGTLPLGSQWQGGTLSCWGEWEWGMVDVLSLCVDGLGDRAPCG